MHHVMLMVDYSVNQVTAGQAGCSVLRGVIAIAAERNGSPEIFMSFALIERWGTSVAAPGWPQRLQALAGRLISPLSAWYGCALS